MLTPDLLAQVLQFGALGVLAMLLWLLVGAVSASARGVAAWAQALLTTLQGARTDIAEHNAAMREKLDAVHDNVVELRQRQDRETRQAAQ